MYSLVLLLFSLGSCHGFTATTSTTTKPKIISSTWDYKGHPIAYDKLVGKEESGDSDGGETVLLLNGFGMGTFHQHRLMEKLVSSESSIPTTVYGMDYLGQGASWPHDCNDGLSEAEEGLRYCGSTWVDQTIQFLESTIMNDSNNKRNKKVHLVGNSVGGHLAVCIAAARPDLVETVTLLNATPVWGLNLPGWSGHLPAPTIPKAVGRYLFDIMRDERTIQNFLKETYVNEYAYDTTLIQNIRNTTMGKGGHAAFASILWSPPVTVQLPNGKQTTGFYDCLQAVQCDVLLCFGRDDPWCKPAFARRMLETLQDRSNNDKTTQRYIELSDVGHCANHEAPTATALVLRQWLSTNNRKDMPLLTDKEVIVQEIWGSTTLQEKTVDDIPLNFVDRLAVRFV